MSKVTYDASTTTITVDDTQVEEALGNLQSKTPAVLKVAINTTARQMRKDEIAEAEKRYALVTKGKQKLKGLKQTHHATNQDLVNIHRQSDGGHKLDMSYYEHRPLVVRNGRAAVQYSPEFHSVRILRGEGFENLEAKENRSKAFLARFTNTKSGTEHIGMVSRKLNKESDHLTTVKGHKRWKPAGWDKPQALETQVRPGASSMQCKVWKTGVEQTTEKRLEENVEKRIQQVVDAARKKGR